MQSDFPALTSGTVQADDKEALLRFVEEDLSGPTVRAVVVGSTFVRVVTDLATHGVKVVDDCVGMIENANRRRPDDHIYDAVEVHHRLRLARSRKSAEERVCKLGLGVKPWIDAKGESSAGDQVVDDIPTWYALILLEAFTWLREQFRFYPVEVLHPPSREDADLAWIAPREDADRDIQRKLMGLRPAYDALSRELKYDDGKANWTLSRVDTLAGDPERLPELSYEGTGFVGGRLAFTFATSEVVVLGQTLYLRPRRDSGFERAIRRRL